MSCWTLLPGAGHLQGNGYLQTMQNMVKKGGCGSSSICCKYKLSCVKIQLKKSIFQMVGQTVARYATQKSSMQQGSRGMQANKQDSKSVVINMSSGKSHLSRNGATVATPCLCPRPMVLLDTWSSNLHICDPGWGRNTCQSGGVVIRCKT